MLQLFKRKIVDYVHVCLVSSDIVFVVFCVCVLQAILQDLFPGVEIPEHDYGRLQEEIESVAVKKGLQCVAAQVKKVIQLYETMLVRHGVMLVGPTGSGKTTVYQVRSHCQKLQGFPISCLIFGSS